MSTRCTRAKAIQSARRPPRRRRKRRKRRMGGADVACSPPSVMASSLSERHIPPCTARASVASAMLGDTPTEAHMTRRSLAALLVAASATIVLAACSAGTNDDAGSGGSDYITEGKLTIGTGEPAYYPWVLDDGPETGEGFEAAIAYAVAEELGFAADDVVWVRTTFDEAIAPGPKNFDFNLQQFSITDERKQNVDFSSPYYETTQVVITTAASAAAGATSIADLKGFLI